MAHQFFIDKRVHNGMTYKEYFSKIQNRVEGASLSELSPEEKEKIEKLKLNFQRMIRIHKTYKPDRTIQGLINNITDRQLWIVITEDWCGDSAQTLPCISEIANLNPMIELKILERDKNIDIMDIYLSETGTRSIPKLVAFSEEGEELFQWGARPKEGQELVDKLKSEGKTKDEFLEKLHLWYARNRGKAIETEFIQLLIETMEPAHK